MPHSFVKNISIAWFCRAFDADGYGKLESQPTDMGGFEVSFSRTSVPVKQHSALIGRFFVPDIFDTAKTRYPELYRWVRCMNSFDCLRSYIGHKDLL